MLFYIFEAINQKLLLDVATSTFNTTTARDILNDAVENSWLTVVGGDKGEWGMRRAHYLPNNSSIIIMDFIQACGPSKDTSTTQFTYIQTKSKNHIRRIYVQSCMKI